MLKVNGLFLPAIIINCFLVEASVTTAVKTTAEKKLIRDLLDRYKQYGVIGRPVKDSRQQMKVQYGLQLIQILGLDENKQLLKTNCWTVYRWNDALLRWNASQYDGIEAVRVFPSQIWTPDIKLYNFADERLQEAREAGLVVYNNGNILWLQQALFKSTCQVEITYFPFDSQVCMLEFGSLSYDKDLLELEWWTPDESTNPMPYVDFSDYIPANDWYTDGEAERHLPHEDRTKQIRSVKMYRARYTTVGNVKLERHYTVLRYLVRLHRNPSFHLFILVAPCILLSLLTLVVFWLPPNSPAKMMLGINIFVAFFVLLLLLAKSMPSSVKNFPLIGIFFCLNMTMITLSTFLATTAVNFFYCGTDGHPPPLWVRHLIIDGLGRILCLRENIPLPARMSRPVVEAAQPCHVNKSQRKALASDGFYNETKWEAQAGVVPAYQNPFYCDGALQDADGFATTQPSTNTSANRINQNAKQIRWDVSILQQRNSFNECKEYAAMEWRTLSLIVDRMFFFLYLATMMLAIAAVVWNTETTDMGQLLTKTNSVASLR